MVNILIFTNIMFFIKPKILRIKLLQKRLKFSFFRACRANFALPQFENCFRSVFLDSGLSDE